MKEKRLSIIINRPVADVFLFTITPANTPLWIDGIVEEKTSEWPVKKGTVYKNRGTDGPWSSYAMALFKENKEFRLTAGDNNYNVHYDFFPLDEKTTQLTYREWVERGELEQPFEQSILDKLKRVMES